MSSKGMCFVSVVGFLCFICLVLVLGFYFLVCLFVCLRVVLCGEEINFLVQSVSEFAKAKQNFCLKLRDRLH